MRWLTSVSLNASTRTLERAARSVVGSKSDRTTGGRRGAPSEGAGVGDMTLDAGAVRVQREWRTELSCG